MENSLKQDSSFHEGKKNIHFAHNGSEEINKEFTTGDR
jgi:hypothetical protein